MTSLCLSFSVTVTEVVAFVFQNIVIIFQNNRTCAQLKILHLTHGKKRGCLFSFLKKNVWHIKLEPIVKCNTFDICYSIELL